MGAMSGENLPSGASKFVKKIRGLTSRGVKTSNGERELLRSSSFSNHVEVDKRRFLTCRKKSSSKVRSVPGDIPHGCLAVYVEGKRYVISAEFLNHDLFKELLKKSEEEFGFEYHGGINIACNPFLFERMLWLIINDDPSAKAIGFQELVASFGVQH